MPSSSAKVTPATEPPSAAEKERAGKARPFDTRELDWLPKANDNDPPYRSWWVIDRD